MSKSFDIVIIGGGLAGCTLASRLHSLKPDLAIVVVEAGPDVTNHPLLSESYVAQLLVGSELDWKYKTVEQKHLKGRILSQNAGKALGGSSAINAGKHLSALRAWKTDRALSNDKLGLC